MCKMQWNYYDVLKVSVGLWQVSQLQKLLQNKLTYNYRQRDREQIYRPTLLCLRTIIHTLTACLTSPPWKKWAFLTRPHPLHPCFYRYNQKSEFWLEKRQKLPVQLHTVRMETRMNKRIKKENRQTRISDNNRINAHVCDDSLELYSVKGTEKE